MGSLTQIIGKKLYVDANLSFMPLKLPRRLRAGSRMKLPDAIHAATAIHTDCDLFLTNDDRFGHLKSPEMLFLGDIE